MKNKKKKQKRNKRCRAAAAVGFDVSTSSASLCPREVQSARVLSTPLGSPPRCRALHLLVFSTPSASPPPHLLHFLVAFSTSPSRSPPPPRLLHSGVMFSMPLSCPLCWCSPRRHRFGHYAGVVFSRCSLSRCPVGCLLRRDRAALAVAGVSGKPSRWSLCRRWVLSGDQGR
jgi:hypothetical protein